MQRRATYERLYAEYREARRALDAAKDRLAGTAELRYLAARFAILREQLRRWHREA